MNAELIKALRNCAATWNTIDDCNAAGCPFTAYGSTCIDTMLEAAADALEADEKRIAELLPKEGEWIWDKDGMDFNIGSWKCSRCQERPNTYWQGEKNINPLRFSGSRFCPNCGARMDGAE